MSVVDPLAALFWKIKRDSYYHPLLSTLGHAGIEEAGFFYDTASQDSDLGKSLDWLCTPLNFGPLPERPAVLLSTGAFCPAHEGHIEMMQLARNAVEQAGYQVLGAYLSPGHDEYINSKAGESAIPIHQRIQHLYQLIASMGQADWLAVDPWEGLFNHVAVNFTDVLQRLELYLAKHLGQPISVFYVCGGDNARFALTFLEKGHCVVVGRPPYEERFLAYRARLQACQNILWVEGQNPKNSAQIRQESTFSPAPLQRLKLRIEEQDPREWPLVELLKAYFSEIEGQYLSQQQQLFQQLDKSPIISLDALLQGDFTLAISRCYDLFGGRFLGYTARPGYPALSEQLKTIPIADNYYLFDDDQHSGGTLQFAQQLLRTAGIGIQAALTLSTAQKGEETLDCRDFLIGGAQSGLVLQLGAEMLRVPYCYPYVCPFLRASIAHPIAFSKAVWELNAAHFQAEGTLLLDLPAAWQLLFSYIGFSPHVPMADICSWHATQLTL